uniref:Cytoplasmic tRNA 2-thiolation protein 2 n=1 Tax=Haemonchus contortus TaxID=6289 RepID=A0A7I4YKD3_HAECO
MVICVICQKALTQLNGKRSSAARTQNVVLLMSLSLAGYVDLERARSLVEKATKRQAYVCHIHVVQAAQYISAEMVMYGKRFAHFEDPSASGRTAYVTDGDIPQELVNAINRMAEGITAVTFRDVSRFLNDALKRYYATSLWEVKVETDVGGDAHPMGDDGGKPKNLSEILYPNGAIKSSGSDEDIHQRAISTSSFDEFAPDDDTEYASLPMSDHPPSLQETDPEALDRYYLVKGNLLMQLFRLCPRCGHKLSAVQLTPTGTAAIVNFVCEDCYVHQPYVKRWESQERDTIQREELLFKCET